MRGYKIIALLIIIIGIIIIFFIPNLKNFYRAKLIKNNDKECFCGIYICDVINTHTKKKYIGASIISKKTALGNAMAVCRSFVYPDYCVSKESCAVQTDRDMNTG